MFEPILTLATIAALIEMIHVGKELWEKFHNCSSAVDILCTFISMSSLEQAGTLSCLAILVGTLAAACVALYRAMRISSKADAQPARATHRVKAERN